MSQRTVTWRRCGRWLTVAFALLLLSACQAEAVVDLDVEASGAGTVRVAVRVDRDADEALGGFADRLVVADLEDAGWNIERASTSSGSSVTATKRVPSAGQWQAVLDEIAGPGVFNDVAVTATDEFAITRQEISFTLDLSDGWSLFSDGEPFAAPIEELIDGRPLDDLLALTIEATVANDGDDTELSGVWTPRFDRDESLDIVVASTAENSLAILLRWIAIALASLFALATVLAITGIVLQRRSDRLRPTPTRTSLASRVPGAEATTAKSPSPASGRDAVRLVVLEPLSVLYGQARPIDDVLLPFVRTNGGAARADTILQGHRALLAGSMETAAFWDLCGLKGQGEAMDLAFLATRTLHDDAPGFFAEMQRRRIPVAAATNDAATWSTQLRDRDHLSAVWPWLVSASVGTQTSNIAMFEVLRRESGVAHEHCLYVDSNLDSLAVAQELGMKTAFFDHGNLDVPSDVGHPVVTNLKGLFGSK